MQRLCNPLPTWRLKLRTKSSSDWNEPPHSWTTASTATRGRPVSGLGSHMIQSCLTEHKAGSLETDQQVMSSDPTGNKSVSVGRFLIWIPRYPTHHSKQSTLLQTDILHFLTFTDKGTEPVNFICLDLITTSENFTAARLLSLGGNVSENENFVPGRQVIPDLH